MIASADPDEHVLPGWRSVTGPECVQHRVAIAGQVVDAVTHRPIAGAIVELERPPDRARTAPDGHFHFLDLSKGKYKLSALLPGAGTRYGEAGPLPVTVKSGRNGKPVLQANLQLPPTTVQGTVRSRQKQAKSDGSDGGNQGSAKPKNTSSEGGRDDRQRRTPAKDKDEPLAFAEVRVLGSGERTHSDAGGNYRLIGLEAGKDKCRTIAVSAQGYEEQRRSLPSQEPGQVLSDVDFILTPP